MTLLEHSQPMMDFENSMRTVDSMHPEQLQRLVRAWDDISLFEEIYERTATADEVDGFLNEYEVADLPPLGPGARVEYTHQSGSKVQGQLSQGSDWIWYSKTESGELDEAWLTVEVPLTHAMFERSSAPTQQIHLNVRDVGLLSDEPGRSALRLM